MATSLPGDLDVDAGYHLPMEDNRPYGKSGTQAPPAPQWPPYYPVPKPARRWLPVAIIMAAVMMAVALVVAAVIISDGGGSITPSADRSPAVVPSRQAAADSSTCDAWRSTLPALKAIPGLPAGWNWDTPNIDTYISNLNAAVNKSLAIFEPKIAVDPPDVATAAHAYVSAKRSEMQKLLSHTYTQADGVEGNIAGADLNEICGLPAEG